MDQQELEAYLVREHNRKAKKILAVALVVMIGGTLVLKFYGDTLAKHLFPELHAIVLHCNAINGSLVFSFSRGGSLLCDPRPTTYINQ